MYYICMHVYINTGLIPPYVRISFYPLHDRFFDLFDLYPGGLFQWNERTLTIADIARTTQTGSLRFGIHFPLFDVVRLSLSNKYRAHSRIFSSNQRKKSSTSQVLLLNSTTQHLATLCYHFKFGISSLIFFMNFKFFFFNFSKRRRLHYYKILLTCPKFHFFGLILLVDPL